MGKIVLVEPHKVLQQAIALSLFPEHEVQVEETVSASGIAALQGIDLLIVDAAALRDSDRLSPEIARAIQSSPIPTVWIDEDEAARAGAYDRPSAVDRSPWIVREISTSMINLSDDGQWCERGESNPHGC